MLELIGLVLFSLVSLTLFFGAGLVCLCGCWCCFCRGFRWAGRHSGSLCSILCGTLVFLTLLFLAIMVTYHVVASTLGMQRFPPVGTIQQQRPRNATAVSDFGLGTVNLNGLVIDATGNISRPVPRVLVAARQEVCWPAPPDGCADVAEEDSRNNASVVIARARQ